MEEIMIEQKKPFWRWLIAGLVVIVALLVIFLVFRDNHKHPDALSIPNEYNRIGVNENYSTVAAYMNFVEGNNVKKGLDHAYTNEALTN